MLRLAGRELLPVGMPYVWLETLYPPLKLSGNPIRLMVMTQLAVTIRAAFGLRALTDWGQRGPMLAGVWLTVTMVEDWPAPVPTLRLEPPLDQ